MKTNSIFANNNIGRNLLISCLTLAVASCGSLQAKESQPNQAMLGKQITILPQALPVANKPATQQAVNIGDVPTIGKVTTGITKISFLADTVISVDTDTAAKFAGNNPNQKVIGKIGTKNIIYLNKTDKQTFSQSASILKSAKSNVDNRKYIVSYNHRHKLFGVFSGYVNLVMASANVVDAFLQKYPVKVALRNGKYLVIKITTLSDTPKLIKQMQQDKNVVSLKVKSADDSRRPM